MTGFDAELYLRLSGERSLITADNTLLDYARALVAVDALDADVAQRIIDDYASARRLRTGRHPHRHHRTKQVPAEPIAPRRTVQCSASFAEDWGSLRVRSISLSSTGVRVSVLMQPHVSGGPAGWSRRQLAVSDEHGTTVSATFSGGGSPEEWFGHYTCTQPLAIDTRWVEILGQRIELADRAVVATVRIESLAVIDPAERYLTHFLEQMSHNHRRGPGRVEDAVAALIACGAVQAESALVTETLEVAQALQQRGLGQASPTLPAQWRSLLTNRGRTGGPIATLVIGAVTRVFGGISAAVSELDSTEDGFQIELEIEGPINGAGYFDDSVEQNDLTYAARDDRGNHYLGALNGWSGGDDGLQGRVKFWPALDPKATKLDLVLSASLERAVISVPLDWDERS